MVTTAERVAEARRKRGLTQKELATNLGVSIWHVDRIEAGQEDPGSYLKAIADATDRDEEWFRPSAIVDKSTALATETRRPTIATGRATAGRVLVLGAIALLVTIRFFTEVVPVIPRAANFVDLPIFLALGTAATVVSHARGKKGRHYLFLGLPALGFLYLCVVSAVVNSGRVEPAPVLVFIYGVLAPMGIYAATHSLWPPGNAGALFRLLIALGVSQLVVVVLIDLPRFIASGNPDLVSGTFGTNPYQLVYFLLVFMTVVAGTFVFNPASAVARAAPFLIAGSLGTILLAQYRALLATTALTIVVVGIFLGRRIRGIAIVAAAVTAFVVMFSYVSSNFPVLGLERTAGTLTQSPDFYVTERIKVANAVARLYEDQPLAILAGTGPGTFSSRAWQTFSLAGSTSASNVQGSYALALIGDKTYETDVSREYVRPQLESNSIIEGSRAVSSPYSSYLSVLAEVGVFGLVLVAGMYVAALIRVGRMTLASFRSSSGLGDPLPPLLLATTIAFLTLLQLGFLENWLEVTRVTFIAWMMLAVVTKEFDFRSARR